MRTYRNKGRRGPSRGEARFRPLVARLRVVALGLLVAEVLAVAVNRSLVRVAGTSMEPALTDGDVLLTRPATRRCARPGRLVVVADPRNDDHLVVKRVRSVTAEGVDVRGDLPERSTDSRAWGPVPASAIRRIVVARWPDLRTPLHHRPDARLPGTDRRVDGRGDGQAGRVATRSSSGSSKATSPAVRRP